MHQGLFLGVKMPVFHGHEVDKIKNCLNRQRPIIKTLDECYGRSSAAKKSIYKELMLEFSDTYERGIWSFNTCFFTFVAQYDDGYIYVTHTKRIAYIY